MRTVPPVTDLLDGTLDATRIRQVRVEDLLRRPLAKEHTPAAHDVFTDRTVVVTGAAGSIGSELARQVMALEPRHIALVDQAESALYFIEREIDDRVAQRRARGTVTDTVISAHLVDITDAQAVRRLFERCSPDIVLHAAAYKHVPMLEDHPSKAVETNIGGTMSVLDAAEAVGVERFVLVSTDKAVWPSSVMGASKRVAEMVVADAARRTGRPYIAVRFGNVLGSNGSVVPIFQDQLEKGQPLSITDPEMTRYFMTIPEASWLILDAAAIAESGGLYVLDMGEPVRIMDIARDLVRLSGRDPESVPFKVIGLRKGEKLHEELFYRPGIGPADDGAQGPAGRVTGPVRAHPGGRPGASVDDAAACAGRAGPGAACLRTRQRRDRRGAVGHRRDRRASERIAGHAASRHRARARRRPTDRQRPTGRRLGHGRLAETSGGAGARPLECQ